METGGHPDRGVCAAVDVRYLRAGGARAAAVLAAGAAFAHALAVRTAAAPRVAPCRPGESCLRKLPPLRAALDGLSGLGLLVAGGYADLDPAVGPAWARMATHAVPVVRGSSVRRLRPGCPQPTRRT